MPGPTAPLRVPKEPMSDWLSDSPAWLRAPLALPPAPRLVALAVGVGVCGDLAVRSGVASIAGALAVVALSAALLVSGRVTNPQARATIAAAPLFGVWVAVRTSPWLVAPDLLAASGLLLLGASLARGGSVAELTAGGLTRRVVHAGVHASAALGMLRLRRHRDRPDSASRPWPAVARGVFLALPVLAVLGSLLASADVVFRSLVDLDVSVGETALHAILIGLASWGALALLRIASAADPSDLGVRTPRLGTIEATIVLAAVVVLFTMFVTTQLVAAAGGADHVLETAGLTRAEYARSGFFQLLWVAGLTVVGLFSLTSATEGDGPGGRRLRALSATTAVLALPVVIVAIVRLDLYRDAYGWTMLRFYCTAAACWIGAVLVLLAVALAGPARLRGRGWFISAAICAGLAVLLTLDVVNPEAAVARHNLTRDAGVAFDPAYLADLSDDAVPTIVSLLPELDTATADAVVAALGCPYRGDPGWAGWNLGADRAADARREICTG